MKKIGLALLSLSVIVAAVVAAIIFSLYSGDDEYKRIKSLQNFQRYEESLALLDKILANNQGDTYALHLAGIANLNCGKLDAAEEHFNREIKETKNFWAKRRCEENIAKEYAHTFFENLPLGAPLGQDGYVDISHLFAEMLKFYSVPNFLEDVADELEKRGNSYLRAGADAIADEHYYYLAEIMPDKREKISKAYFKIFLGLDDELDAEYKGAIINRAAAYWHDDELAEIHADYFFKLSQRANSSEEALGDLAMANQFSTKYRAELFAAQEKFEQENFAQIQKNNISF